MESTTIALLVLVPLLLWRIFSRLKRMVVRQPSQLWRHWATVIGFALLLIPVGWTAARGDMLAAACLGAGVLGGFWLALLGLRLTRFESTEKGYFFTPHPRLAVVVGMLFAARVLYRGMELYINSRQLVPQPMPHDAFAQSPLTMLSVGLVIGYFAVYSWGLIRWRRTQKPLPKPADFE